MVGKRKLPYETTNYLSGYLTQKQHQISKERDWKKVLLREVEEELAAYCSVTRDTIVQIKRGINQPSLSLAMKISQYFNVAIEELFTLKED